MSDVEVRRSRIEGLGVFATRRFRAGERITRVHVVREITLESPIREELGERLDHCAYPDGKMVLWGSPDRHVNHSCDPNAWELFEGDDSFLVARREILDGEEITCDYNINIVGGSSWPCTCGAARCSGQVVGDFFSLPSERQREYAPFLAEWFVRRHRDRLEASNVTPAQAASSLRGRIDRRHDGGTRRSHVSIRVIARFVARPEAASELREILHAVVAPTRQEAGCVSYELLESASRPGDFAFVEEWESREILDRHLAMPYLKAMLAHAPALLEQEIFVGIYDLIA